MVTPRSWHRILGPHRPGRRGALAHDHGIEEELLTARTAPSERRLAHKIKRCLLEARLGQILPDGAQSVRVPPAVVRLQRPCHFDDRPGLPLHTRGHVRQLRPEVAHFGVRRVRVLRAKAPVALTGDAAAGSAAGVNHRGRPGPAPRRVEEVVVGRAALSARVDGPLLWVAHGGVERVAADGGLGAHWDGSPRDRFDFAVGRCARPGLAPEFRDRASGVAIARVASNCTAIAEPEAGLSICTSEVPARVCRSCVG
mmetsp:Transcript_19480/g.58034  ORF Transcript_19480/g.58034 Transcript_19480/m.58034 type:complete len:255 (-) Transcript_19480:164-928(-)